MCIKGGRNITLDVGVSTVLASSLESVALSGDVIEFVRPLLTPNHWALYIGKGLVIDFNRSNANALKMKSTAYVAERKLQELVQESTKAIIWRCCDRIDCYCLTRSVKEALKILEDVNKNIEAPFNNNTYNLLTENCESFCYFCVHGKFYTHSGRKALSYLVGTGGGGAAGTGLGVTIGAIIGVAGGPFAPITLPIALGVGAVIGAGVGSAVGASTGGIVHATQWSELTRFCDAHHYSN